jgi:hypothetical protein
LEGEFLAKKSSRPLVISGIITASVWVATIVIFIGISVWDFWWGLTLLYTLLPAMLGFSCVAIVIAAIISYKISKEEKMILETIIQSTDEQQQKHQFCPNCGTAFLMDQKICLNCSYGL